MRSFFYFLVTAFVFTEILVSAAGGEILRDWSTSPAVVEFDSKCEMYAIGDAHSDYARFARAIRAAGLIERIPSKPGSDS